MRLPAFLVLATLSLASCDSNPVAVIPVATVQRAWIGSYDNGPGQGDMVLDLARNGTALSGEIVLGPSDPIHVWVQGTVAGDSVLLSLDSAHPSNPADFSLRARLFADGSLSGTIASASVGIDADFSCSELTRRRLERDETRTVPYRVIAIAFDGSLVWLSTVGCDYPRMEPNGAVVDTVTVFRRPGAHWTSSALMFDGAFLWGAYPVTISGPGGSVDVAELWPFDENGLGSDSVEVAHRPNGLAYDGSSGWSLRVDPVALIRFDATAATSDSLPLGIPDANQLAFDGTRFWTVGWHMRRLYEVDAGGSVVSLCDLPIADTSSLTTGLTVEGSHVWWAEGVVGSLTSTLHRMTIR